MANGPAGTGEAGSAFGVGRQKPRRVRGASSGAGRENSPGGRASGGYDRAQASRAGKGAPPGATATRPGWPVHFAPAGTYPRPARAGTVVPRQAASHAC